MRIRVIKLSREGEISFSHPSVGISSVIGVSAEGVRASVSKALGGSFETFVRPVPHHERVQGFLVWRADFLDRFRL